MWSPTDPGTVFELVPLALSVVLVAIFAVFIAGFILSRVRPPTDEPIIGSYRFTLKGTGRTVEGVTTTALGVVDQASLRQLDGMGSRGSLLKKVLGDLHLYAVRDGRSKILVVSDVPVETMEYSDSERGTRFTFPHGWVSYRNVYGYGGEVTPETYPDFFNYFVGEWDGGIYIYPENLRTGDHSPGLKKGEDLTQALLLLKEASSQTERIRTKDEVIGVQERFIEELADDYSEQVDRAQLSRMRELRTSPFAGEEPEAPRRGFLPRMNKLRVVSILAGAGLGYLYLPQHSQLLPNSAALVGGVGMYLFWLAWDNWLEEII